MREIRTVQITAFVLGLVLVLAGCGSGGSPSATFDGEDCGYSGPAAVDAGDVEIVFVNNSDVGAGLAFLTLIDESAREEEVALIGTRIPVQGQNPEGAVRLAGVLEANAGEEATQTVPMSTGTYLLDCVTFSTAGPDEVWRVAVLEVQA